MWLNGFVNDPKPDLNDAGLALILFPVPPSFHFYRRNTKRRSDDKKKWRLVRSFTFFLSCIAPSSFFSCRYRVLHSKSPLYIPTLCALSPGGGPMLGTRGRHELLVWFMITTWKKCNKNGWKCQISRCFAPHISNRTQNSKFSDNFGTENSLLT